jgi:dienelactone hydrolase
MTAPAVADRCRDEEWAARAYGRSVNLEYEPGEPFEWHVDAGGGVVGLTYESPRGGQVPGLLSRPEVPGPYPAVVFFHHGGRQTVEGFRAEAGRLAKYGIASLFVTAPWLRPENHGLPTVPNTVRYFEQSIVDVMRALELLASMADIDGGALALVGHGFGAAVSVPVLARSHQVHAGVLMAPSPRLSETMLAGRHPFWRGADPAELASESRLFADLDAEHTVGKIRVMVLLQFGERDEFVSAAAAQEFSAAAPAHSIVRRYDAGHGLNEAAGVDRLTFLREVLTSL